MISLVVTAPVVHHIIWYVGHLLALPLWLWCHQSRSVQAVVYHSWECGRSPHHPSAHLVFIAPSTILIVSGSILAASSLIFPDTYSVLVDIDSVLADAGLGLVNPGIYRIPCQVLILVYQIRSWPISGLVLSNLVFITSNNAKTR